MTRYVHDYDPPLKYGALIQQAEIEGGASVTWTRGLFTPNGVTTVFALPTTPTANSLVITLNGQEQYDIAMGGLDYSLSGKNVTMTVAPLASDTFAYKYT